VTSGDSADREHVLNMLNEALATPELRGTGATAAAADWAR